MTTSLMTYPSPQECLHIAVIGWHDGIKALIKALGLSRMSAGQTAASWTRYRAANRDSPFIWWVYPCASGDWDWPRTVEAADAILKLEQASTIRVDYIVPILRREAQTDVSALKQVLSWHTAERTVLVIVSSHLEEDSSKWWAMSTLGRAMPTATKRIRQHSEAGRDTIFLFVEEHFRYSHEADAVYGVLVRSVRARLQARSRTLDAPLPGSAVGLNLERWGWGKYLATSGLIGAALLFAFTMGANAASRK